MSTISQSFQTCVLSHCMSKTLVHLEYIFIYGKEWVEKFQVIFFSQKSIFFYLNIMYFFLTDLKYHYYLLYAK